MAALTKDRDTPKKHGDYVRKALMAATPQKCFNGGLVNRNSSGYAKAASDTASERCIGVAKQTVTGGTAAGDESVQVEDGIFAFGTTGGNALTQADVGNLAYVLDDQTIVRAAGTVNSVIAGVVIEFVSASEIYIDTRRKAV